MQSPQNATPVEETPCKRSNATPVEETLQSAQNATPVEETQCKRSNASPVEETVRRMPPLSQEATQLSPHNAKYNRNR